MNFFSTIKDPTERFFCSLDLVDSILLESDLEAISYYRQQTEEIRSGMAYTADIAESFPRLLSYDVASRFINSHGIETEESEIPHHIAVLSLYSDDAAEWELIAMNLSAIREYLGY